MKNVKFLKLVNDERKLTRIASAKSCTVPANDLCVLQDDATCTGSYDYCIIDKVGCPITEVDICDVDLGPIH